MRLIQIARDVYAVYAVEPNGGEIYLGVFSLDNYLQTLSNGVKEWEP